MSTRAARAARHASSTTIGTPNRGESNQATTSGSTTPARKKQRTTRTRLRLDENRDDDDDAVRVSSNVRITAADEGGSEDDSSKNKDEEINNAHRDDNHGRRRLGTRHQEEGPAGTAPSNQQAHGVATPQTIVVPAKETMPRRKELKIDDFRGKPGESVEAWLASVLEEVKNQEHLGGDTWTASELFHGAVPHLKEKAQKWYLSLTESMRSEDCTFAFLVEWMRAKYGPRDNAWQVQQRLAKRVQQPGERLSEFAAGLLDIGFGKIVSAESYIEAFLNGMNNEIMATQVRVSDTQTLEEAVQYAEDKCGEFGEGRKATDWRVAERPCRIYRNLTGDDDSGRLKMGKTEVNNQSDWKKLGRGFGGGEHTPPVYDTPGKLVSGLAQTAKKDPLSLAVLQALMTMVAVGKIAEASGRTTKTAAAKPKARTLEVKAERSTAAEGRDRGPAEAAASQYRRGNNGGSSGGRCFGG
ncbi:unnamed protein product [Phytophthora fragariaefolia]|uniref:Unnamed protein product n=1 Tax=Phytophthora fragariaefolia TaxID=1490495 RepID=A0A9W6YC12_9STRA|nr:unnamed protein product [Phytophthora fragariaefolia]